MTASFGNLLANVSSEVFLKFKQQLLHPLLLIALFPPKKITNEDGEVQVGRLLRITQKTNGGSSADNDIVFPDASGSNITLTQDAAAKAFCSWLLNRGISSLRKTSNCNWGGGK